MTTQIVIVGCGGFAREVHDVIDAINDRSPTWELLGYLDDNPSELNQSLVHGRGFDVLGTTNWLSPSDRPLIQFVIGIGTGSTRRQIDEILTSRGYPSATLVHPSVTFGYDVRIGPGSVLCAGVRATTHISMGRHVHLNLNTTVGHDSVIADYVTANPLVAISGGVTLGAESTIGTGSAVLQNLTVGERATVGAAACVVRDVLSGTVVKGVPAR